MIFSSGIMDLINTFKVPTNHRFVNPFTSFRELKIRGAQINYYFICKTKLYLFSKNVRLEKDSDIVSIGNFIHKNTYKKENRELIIGSIAIDFVKNKKNGILEIHEVKKSDRMEKADIYQLLYYIYYLKNMGITAVGVLNYPSKKKIKRITLTEQNETELIKIIEDIENIAKGNKPIKPERKSYCKKCAYYEFCFS